MGLAHGQSVQPFSTTDELHNSRADLPRNRDGGMEWGMLVGNLRSDIGRLKQLVVEGDTDVLPGKHEMAEQSAVHLSYSQSLPLGSRVIRPNIADGQTAGRFVTQSTPVQNLSSAHALYTSANSVKPNLVTQSPNNSFAQHNDDPFSHLQSTVGF